MHKHLKTALTVVDTYTYDSSLDCRLGAVIVAGGSVISIGINKTSTNSFVEHYANRVKGRRDWVLSAHAEMDAVLGARTKTDLTGAKIFVARRRNVDNLPGMSRPCAVCEAVLRAYGIKRAYYTIDDHHYGVMHLAAPKADKIVRI